jgi:hypothetical protein
MVPTPKPRRRPLPGLFLLVPPAMVMTISPERLAEIERILSEAAGRSRALRLRRRGFAVHFGPEPGHVQLFTDDGEMIFETRTPRWAAAQFVVMVRHASSTLGTAEPLKDLDGAPVVYRTREQAEIEARRLNRKPKSPNMLYYAAPPVRMYFENTSDQ